MADDVTLPGTGTVVASDDVGGVQYQKVKLFDSTNGSSTEIGTTSNPLKVAEIESDCTSVLSTTITTASVTSGIDTTGYGALVWQISGVWQGNCFFEASNDNTTWDTILVFSRDNLSLQDIITSGGLYTIRPSGKYVRLNVTNITGSMTVNAIGREAEGISAADVLSLAMDASNGTPLNVALQGTRGLVVDQLPEGGIRTGLTTRNYRGFSNVVGTVMVQPVFCGDMNSFSVAWRAALAANIDVQIQMPDGAWASVWGNVAGQTINVGSAAAPNNSGGQPAFFSGLLYGAQYVRLVHGATTTNVHALMQLSNGSPATFQIAGALTVQQPTAGNLTCTNTPATPTAATNLNSAATTNATSVKASAGRIMALSATNNGAAVCFLKLYNKASAPTVGTDTPVQVLSIPANGVPLNLNCGPLGLQFSTGIAYAITNLIGDADTTAIAAGQVKLMMSYV